MNWNAMFRWRSRAAAFVLSAMFLTPSAPAPGAITDPALSLSSASADVGPSARVVRLTGSFPADDLVQLSLPFQVLVRSGSRYVRYDLASGAVAGVAPELADGLDAGEVADLLAQGEPEANARVLLFVPGRIDLLLPDQLEPGLAEAQLFVVHEGDPILSNPLTFELAP